MKVLIRDLVDIPFVTGVIYLKWNLDKVDTTAKKEGFSRRVPIQRHVASWGDAIEFNCNISMSESTSILEPCWVRLKVRQEMKGGKDYVPLGFVEINLSEFAGARETSRRFLLQHSRINATLNITVHTDLVSGPPIFKVPASTASLDAVQEQEEQEANADTAKIAAAQALRDRARRKIPATIEASRRNASDIVNVVLDDIKKES